MDDGDGRESGNSWWMVTVWVTPSSESRTVPVVWPEAAETHGLQSHTRQRVQFRSFSSVAQSCPTLCNPMDCSSQASLSFTNSWSLLKLMSVELVMPSNHLILCRPLLLPPSVFPSIRVFSNESALPIRWSKYWSFSFSISPSSEQPGLISFRMDWLALLAVQGTLRSLLQYHSSKASILQSV